MAKWYVFLFGTVGYLLVVWFYIISPYHSFNVMSFVCPLCPIVMTSSSPWPLYAIVFGPINAGVYAITGYLLWRLIKIGRRRNKT